MLLSTAAYARADFNTAVKAYRARHYATAYKEFMKLARAGNPRAETVIALMTKFGESVPPDAHTAFSWYLKAAKQNFGPALYQVGVMYARGKGVRQNRQAAIKWLKRATRVGFKRAKPELARLDAQRAAPAGPAHHDDIVKRPWDFRLPNSIRDARLPSSRLNPQATYRVDLGSMSTREGAGRLWDALVKHAPAVFANADLLIRLARHSNHRLYRVQTGPFVGLGAALDFCKRVQRHVDTMCQPVAN